MEIFASEQMSKVRPTGVLREKTGVSGEKNMQNTAVSIKKCAKPST